MIRRTTAAAAALVLPLAYCSAFVIVPCPQVLTHSSISAYAYGSQPGAVAATPSSQLQMADDKIAGTFFNPVPEEPSGGKEDGKKDGDDEQQQKKNEPPPAAANKNEPPAATGKEGKKDDPFDFDQSIAQLMARRNKKPLAATPSTIGGVPTSKASGFGKQAKSSPAAGGKPVKKVSPDGSKSFVQLGKPLNDVNNPEYDDQGYTLYADEQTGEKKRVFEALVDYPCKFTMKIVGANEGAFVSEMVQVVAESCEVEVEDIDHSVKVNGKWSSVTVKAPVKSAEMLYMLYENIDRDPRVKFKF